MYQRFHDRFGTAGVVIGVVALVLALVTGAYAAGGGLSAKQKKEVKAIAKSFQGTGPAGAAGTNGTNGTNGEKGAKGDPGTNGTSGAAGKSVVLGQGAPGEGGCTEESTTVQVSGEPATKKYVCNGENGTDGAPGAPGAPGPEGVCSTSSCHLPTNVTETGTWALSAEASPKVTFLELPATPISFAVPLSAGLNSSHVVYLAPGGSNANCDDGNAGNGAPSATNPEADPGFLCVFAAAFSNTGTVEILEIELSVGANRNGALLTTSVTGEGFYGGWAVTGG